MGEIRIRVEADDVGQPIDGFGVNINPVGHWREGALRPVLDRLVDELGASIFRLDPYGLTTWIDRDGSLGRASLTPERHAAVYRSAPFRDAWETARHLNARGAEIVLNVSGVAPRWMCGPDGATLTDLDAYAELLTSLARWAREEEGIRFRLFGPFNETDLGPPEGPFLDPAGVVAATILLAERLDAAGMGDLRLVVADQGRYTLDFARALADEPRLRAAIDVIGMHCYSDIPLDGVPRLLAERGLPWRPWLTEYGELDQTGEMEWEVAVNSTRRLLRGVNDGLRAALVWDAYDNFHEHDDAWTIWGIMRCARGLYTPKKRYWAARQVYRFAPAGWRRVAAEIAGDAGGVSAAAFRGADGDVSIVGLLEAAGPATVRLALCGGVAEGRPATLHVTDPARNGEAVMRCPLGRELIFALTGPAVFTLTTLADDEKRADNRRERGS